MNIIKILAISGFAALLSGCPSGQSQIEGAAPAVVSTGASHVHNVEGHGDITHSHKGNSTANHGHSYNEIKSLLK